MSCETAVLVSLVAFLLGVVAGLALLPRAPALPVVELAPPVVRAGLGALDVVAGDLLDDARGIAAAHLSQPETDGDPVAIERLSEDIAAFGAEQWSRGIGDTREAMIRHSGLEPDLAEDVANLAIEGLEHDRGLAREAQ